MSVVTRIRLGFGIPFLLLTAVGAISYTTAAKIPEASRWVDHTHATIDKLRQTTATVGELFAIQRTSLQSGQPLGADAQRLEAALHRHISEFKAIVRDNPKQVVRVGDLGNQIARWNELVGQGSEIRIKEGLPAATEFFKSEEVKRLGERMRTLLKEIEGHETQLLSERHGLAKRSAQRAMLFIGGGTILALLVAVVASFWLANSIVKPVQQLMQGTVQIGEGALEYRVPDHQSHDEIGVLARAFNSMAVKLQESSNSLTRERNSLRTLIDHLPQLVFIKDTEGRFVVVNQAMMKMQGSTVETVVGKTDFDYFPVAAAESCKSTDDTVLGKGEKVVDFHELISSPDQPELWVSTTKVPIHDHQGNIVGLVGICHDITVQRETDGRIRQLNRELETRARELEQVNKELEAFSYSVSHDLRAPLRHIDGYAELLAKRAGPSLDERCQRYVTVIAESAKEMGQLVDDLLVFSRMGRAEMRSTQLSLANLAHEVAGEIGRDLNGKNPEWTIDSLPTVHGDPAMLRLVFMNLLSNAAKYSRTREKPAVEVGCRPEGEELVVFVRDNGVGFDMQYSHKLFGVFQRLHSSDEFEGTGIGLANVRRIINRHGGRTWAESTLGSGATFYFSLPQQTEAA